MLSLAFIYQVVLDSGSSDLWVNSGTIDPSFTVVDTNVTGAVPYMYALSGRVSMKATYLPFSRDGTAAAGKILLSSVKFGDYIVDQQAFSMFSCVRGVPHIFLKHL